MTKWAHKPTTLYRLYDHEGELLYVGITCRGPARFADHAIEQGWWPEVAATTQAHYPNRADAAAAEAEAIRTEHPRYNVVFTDRRRRHSGPAFSTLPDETIQALRDAAAAVDEAQSQLSEVLAKRDALVCEAYATGATTRELGQIAGVSRAMVSIIVRRQNEQENEQAS